MKKNTHVREDTSMHIKSMWDAHVNPRAQTHTYTRQTPPPHFMACFRPHWELRAERDLAIVADRTALSAPAAPLQPAPVTVAVLCNSFFLRVRHPHTQNMQMQNKGAQVYTAIAINQSPEHSPHRDDTLPFVRGFDAYVWSLREYVTTQFERCSCTYKCAHNNIKGNVRSSPACVVTHGGWTFPFWFAAFIESIWKHNTHECTEAHRSK